MLITRSGDLERLPDPLVLDELARDADAALVALRGLEDDLVVSERDGQLELLATGFMGHRGRHRLLPDGVTEGT